MILVRSYDSKDENKWLECLMFSYFYSDYCDQITNMRPRYENKTIKLVATDLDEIVGIIDIEIENFPGEFTTSIDILSAVITYFGVIPLHRRKGIAKKLIKEAVSILMKDYQVTRLEITLRDNPEIRSIFKKLGFIVIKNSEFYQVSYDQDIFNRLEIELPSSIITDSFSAFITKEVFNELKSEFPSEKTVPYISLKYKKK